MQQENSPIDINALLSEERRTDRSMTYWLERINVAVIAKLWIDLEGFAKAVPQAITWEQWASGTTSKGDSRVAATASITQDGCVLTFTVKDTSTSNGATDDLA